MTAFVYGTLMFPEVLHALIHRVPKMEPAVISGFQRYRIRGQVFPGTIKAAAHCQVRGLVLFDLQPDELEMFDEFEGDEYYKQAVVAELESGSSCTTHVYLWQDSLRSYLYEPDWDPDAFREQCLADYTHMCRKFAANVQEQRSWKGAFESTSSSPESARG